MLHVVIDVCPDTTAWAMAAGQGEPLVPLETDDVWLATTWETARSGCTPNSPASRTGVRTATGTRRAPLARVALADGTLVATTELPADDLISSLLAASDVLGRGWYAADAARVVKPRARAAGLPERISCHTFRAAGISPYLEHGGTVENAQYIAVYESARTTKLFDRMSDEITLDEIERMVL